MKNEEIRLGYFYKLATEKALKTFNTIYGLEGLRDSKKEVLEDIEFDKAEGSIGKMSKPKIYEVILKEVSDEN